jgi:cobalamin biosynthesis protein CobD/CbiB
VMQNPSRRISSAYNVRSPSLAPRTWGMRICVSSALTPLLVHWWLQTDVLLLVCPLPSLLVAIFASAEVGFESLRQTIFLTCRMLSERKILSSVRREEGASR